MLYLWLFVCSLSLANGASLGRVVGGDDAVENKFPYQVSLRTKDPGYKEFHFCGGSIIDESWILTAAHCFDKRDLTNAYVVTGTNYLYQGGEKYKILFTKVHPNYQASAYAQDYDIALVRVRGPIAFNGNVHPVDLPSEDIKQYNVYAAFAGWGSTTVDSPSSEMLQEIKLNVISFEECYNVRPEINRKHVCTYNRIGQGTCYGDSGGPLVLNGVQVGIASYVRPCAVGYPDVFTRVWSYMDWIVETREKYALIFFN